MAITTTQSSYASAVILRWFSIEKISASTPNISTIKRERITIDFFFLLLVLIARQFTNDFVILVKSYHTVFPVSLFGLH